MRTPRSTNFETIYTQLRYWLATDADKVQSQSWQSQDVSNNPAMQSHEIRNVVFETPCGFEQGAWASVTKANLPWAEDHFQERVSGIPMNPPPSEAYWPYAVQGNQVHKEGEQFSHTYPERMWPCLAGAERGKDGGLNMGIRFRYGDLEDVVDLIRRDVHTRQAYLPIWFPEDTGVVHGKRVPCSLGYHFMVRHNTLHVNYTIRSCDFLRHFRDDVYMAGRLAHWVAEQFEGMQVGNLTMFIGSLHIFEGDVDLVRFQASKDRQWNA